ncbi:9031_t:CDS:2 [Entrophospora sp. SA101]|nr:9031_t:CDS:2 [Entrophospora sp. SA101]
MLEELEECVKLGELTSEELPTIKTIEGWIKTDAINDMNERDVEKHKSESNLKLKESVKLGELTSEELPTIKSIEGWISRFAASHKKSMIEKIVEQFEIIGLIDSNSQKSEAIKFAASKTQNM